MLEDCIRALSEYHNEVSVNFKGSYPSRPYEQTLKMFETALENGCSHIAVIEEAGSAAGFCKIDTDGQKGKLDYLMVMPEYHGKGYGRALMDWAMAGFDRYGVHCIEVKVVDGNSAINLYEKYGFKMNAHILVGER